MKKQIEHRYQVGGDHYLNMSIQPWDVMRSTMSHEAWLGFLRGNVIKYLMRDGSKRGSEDLRKAHHYLEVLLEELESHGVESHGAESRYEREGD